MEQQIGAPITLRPAPTLRQREHWSIPTFGWDHANDGFGELCLTEDAFMAFAMSGNRQYYGRQKSEQFSLEETRSALNLIRSYLWRVLTLSDRDVSRI